MRRTSRRSSVRVLSLGAVVLLLPIAVLLAAHVSRPTYGYQIDAQTERAGLLKLLKGPKPPTTARTEPEAAPEGYALAKPGDRTPAGEPSALRKSHGSVDEMPGVLASFCPFSHSAQNDPIVFPGQAGASHLHDFFGNVATDANSTADSLRNSGMSTCNTDGDTSSYWVPALYESGSRIVPDYMSAYYGAGDKDPATIEPFPRGLELLLKDTDRTQWYCFNNDPSTPLFEDPPTCPGDTHLGKFIVFPDCWDGKYLDVPDHRSHMAYPENGSCPSTHPVPVTQLRLFVSYTQVHTGSVVLAPQANPSVPHADFLNSWNQEMLTQLVRDCIKADVFCDGTM